MQPVKIVLEMTYVCRLSRGRVNSLHVLHKLQLRHTFSVFTNENFSLYFVFRTKQARHLHICCQCFRTQQFMRTPTVWWNLIGGKTKQVRRRHRHAVGRSHAHPPRPLSTPPDRYPLRKALMRISSYTHRSYAYVRIQQIRVEKGNRWRQNIGCR